VVIGAMKVGSGKFCRGVSDVGGTPTVGGVKSVFCHVPCLSVDDHVMSVSTLQQESGARRAINKLIGNICARR
jgi:hypothetical protein